ncbi:hypothetical protein QFC19_000021 [Naganishia cerealis]|uniref:Uncharacterized protein n=1 Tax=Naganishia cerealis TaxID=610337 RepID=A0ACC2WPZ6_9TREE|nr:hypothetical protein QFC19_000021 [Naganishia cerealis]
MTCNLADLDPEVLLMIAQHLILSSSVSCAADDFDSHLCKSSNSSTKNGSSRYPASTASSSRTDINALLNSTDSIQYRPFGENLSPLRQHSQAIQSSRPRPAFLLPLLLTCHKIHAALSVEGNPKLYSWLYETTFDTAAIKRRWTSATIPSWHFHQDTKSSCYSNGEDDRCSKRQKLDDQQPIPPVSVSSNAYFDVTSDPSILAEEYRERLCMFHRFKALHVQFVDAGIQDQKIEMLSPQLVSDLWMIWFMITEHDEKNIPVILEMACLDNCLNLLYQKVYLDDALSPGLPPSTIIKALMGWIVVRLGLSAMLEDTPEELDEKVFALAPFALASFKYPLWIAPWTFRVLPLTKVAESEEELRLISKPNAFMPDLTPRELGVPVGRFGREWNILPNGAIPKPHFAKNINSYDDKSPQIDPNAAQYDNHFPPQFTPDPAPYLVSTQYDQDFIRSMSCASPITSPGLPALYYRNKIEGTWKGAYIFFDFEAYRRLLTGNLRSLYEGAYGHQECEWNILETVINVRLDRLGGNGGFLSAGFKLDQSTEEATLEAQMTPEERGWEPCPDENAPDRPGWTKEIILTGQCRHSWGTSEIYGRVRSWDGLVILRQDFSHRAIGRWLYSGYIHADGEIRLRQRISENQLFRQSADPVVGIRLSSIRFALDQLSTVI